MLIQTAIHMLHDFLQLLFVAHVVRSFQKRCGKQDAFR